MNTDTAEIYEVTVWYKNLDKTYFAVFVFSDEATGKKFVQGIQAWGFVMPAADPMMRMVILKHRVLRIVLSASLLYRDFVDRIISTGKEEET